VAVPSTNSTESWGIVQVESMICGTPSVASDMPGTRRPVQMTGMGKIFPLRDVAGLADSVIDILDHPERFQGDVPGIRVQFSPETISGKYEEIFKELLA
jgi:glycosyltransferase involved in cell wall biosynthesis